MTPDRITELAKQCGFPHQGPQLTAALQDFYKLVRAEALKDAANEVLEAGFKSNGVPAYEFIAKRIERLK